jgi:hypothetical protein
MEDGGWEGVYCHWDGYPTNRGKQIWEIIHRDFINNQGKPGVSNDGDPHKAIKAFVDIYIKGHPGGWSSFPDECYCHNPSFVIRDGQSDGKLTNKTADPLSIEWAYVISQSNMTLTIYAGKEKPGYIPGEIKQEPVYTDDGYWDHGHCAYRFEKVVTINLLGKEPNWKKIESGR